MGFSQGISCPSWGDAIGESSAGADLFGAFLAGVLGSSGHGPADLDRANAPKQQASLQSSSNITSSLNENGASVQEGDDPEGKKKVNANQGGGTQAAFVGGAVLSSGWAADGLDPEPFSTVGGAIVMTGVSAYVLYQNRAIISNTAVSLYNKMTAEIDRIATKAQGPQGFTYALVPISPGLYPNVRGGTTFLSIGDVWKFGQTTSGSRYFDNYLGGAGLRQVNLFPGNQMEIRIQEKVMINGYFMEHGALPQGNSIFR